MESYKDITDFIELTLLDNKGNRVSGETVTYTIYKSLDNTIFQSGTLTEIGVTGIYQDSVVFTDATRYRIEYITPNNFDNAIESVFVKNDIFDMVKRILGLSKENIRLFNPVYNSSHRLLSATFKTYESKTDTESDTNALNEYSVIAEYNSQNELTSFREVRE